MLGLCALFDMSNSQKQENPLIDYSPFSQKRNTLMNEQYIIEVIADPEGSSFRFYPLNNIIFDWIFNSLFRVM